MKPQRPNGFTIVELIIVIAVIGILAAVLIPTFSSLQEKANLSADTRLLKNMNAILATNEALGEHPTNVNEVKRILYNGGINAYDHNINTPQSRGYRFAWDPATNRMLLLAAADTLEAFVLLTDEYTPPITTDATQSAPLPPQWEDPPVACHDLTFELNESDDGYILTKRGNCRCEDLYIPSVHEGLPVVAIGENAFSAENNLYSVSIPPSVTEIAPYAFRRAIPLTRVTVHGNLTKVDVGAFQTTRLQTITFAKGVQEIGDSAFQGCALLTDVDLGTSTVSIGKFAFMNCTKLEDLYLPQSLTQIEESALEGCTALYEICLPSKLIALPSGLLAGCTGLEAVTLPEGLVSIGECAFKNCASLKEILLPAGLQIIEEAAFQECASLSTVQFPENDSFYVDSYAFAYCGFKDLTIPENLLFGDSEYAFMGCRMERLTVNGNGEDFIGDCAFMNCSALREAEINSRRLKKGTFLNCAVLETVRFSEDCEIKGDATFASCHKLKTVNLPQALTAIPDNTFSGCTSLQAITLHEGIKSIGYQAFSECSALQYISLPSTLQIMEDYAFASCTEMKALAFPNGNDCFSLRDNCLIYGKDGNYTLLYCFDLTRGVINEECALDENGAPILPVPTPNGYRDSFTVPHIEDATRYVISQNAFSDSRLTGTLYIPDSVTEIEESAFSSLDMTEVIFNKTGQVKIIGKHVFDDCYSLKKVYLPDSLQTIRSHAFEGSPYLTELSFSGSLIKVYDDAFHERLFASVKKVVFRGNEEDLERFAGNCATFYEAIREEIVLESDSTTSE